MSPWKNESHTNESLTKQSLKKWVPDKMSPRLNESLTNKSLTNKSLTNKSRTNKSLTKQSQKKWVPAKMSPRWNESLCWSTLGFVLVVIQTRTETKQNSSHLDKFFWVVKIFKPKCKYVSLPISCKNFQKLTLVIKIPINFRIISELSVSDLLESPKYFLISHKF